jgi:adenylate cyclase
MALGLGNIAANLAGILVVELLDSVMLSSGTRSSIPAIRVIFPAFLTAAFLLVAGFQITYERPIRQALRGMLLGAELPAKTLARGRRRLLNAPYVLMLVDLVIWCTAALVFSQAVATMPEARHVATMVAMRALLVGLITVSAAFFLLDHMIQHRLAILLFPEGGLSRVKGVVKSRLIVRLMALIFTTVIVPFAAVLLTLRGSAWVLAQGLRPADVILERIQVVVAMEAAIFVATACALTGLLTMSLGLQFKEIREVLREVAHGRFNRRVVVTSNDEMGYAGDFINEMIKGLRERDLIKETFGKYVSEQVRDEILRGNIPLDGEHKEVTVLFADLRNFTPLVESTPPKQVVGLINGYFKEMSEAIQQEGGLVLQFIGDEIEAVFGAPLPLEDHPQRAARAALDMRQRLTRLNRELAGQGYPRLEHGVGIHSGQVVAANIGSPDRLSYALVGDTVNLASRLQGLSKEFDADILLSSVTAASLGPEFRLRPLPATEVKGKSEPVRILALE